MGQKTETALINELIDNAKNGDTITLEKREYHLYEEDTEQLNYFLSNTDVTPTKNIAILFKDKKGITLDGNGATLLCHGRLQPITIDNSSNITVKNLNIDWEIPLSAEGEVVASTGEYTDILIDPALFPHEVRDGTVYFKGENWTEPLAKWGNTCFDITTGAVPVSNSEAFTSQNAEPLGGNIIRFYSKENQPVGAIIVLRHNPRSHAGIYAQDSQKLCFDNINVHATGGLGILCQFCKDLTFTHIHFVANKARGRRVVCGHDDGIHLPNDSGDIIIENCFFYGLMDDAINLHGICTQVTEIIDSKTLRCSFVHDQAKGFDKWAVAGQTISFIEHKSMAPYKTAKVSRFEYLNQNEFIITFDEDIPKELAVLDALENLSNTANLTCRHNFFGPGRARGVLISSPGKIVIENNFFENAGCSILIAGDANGWFESGACHDITIKNNSFSSKCLSSMYQFCEGIISICPEIPEPDVKKPFHSNITIENNHFSPSDYPVLYAFSTKALRFCDNIISRSTQYAPWHHRRHMITLSHCLDVTIRQNRLIGDVLGKDIFTTKTPLTQIDADIPVVV